jgi:hypothetical protein
MLVSSAEDVHPNVWPRGAPEPLRHKLFRDWLRSHPEDRDEAGCQPGSLGRLLWMAPTGAGDVKQA